MPGTRPSARTCCASSVAKALRTQCTHTFTQTYTTLQGYTCAQLCLSVQSLPKLSHHTHAHTMVHCRSRRVPACALGEREEALRDLTAKLAPQDLDLLKIQVNARTCMVTCACGAPVMCVHCASIGRLSVNPPPSCVGARGWACAVPNVTASPPQITEEVEGPWRERLKASDGERRRWEAAHGALRRTHERERSEHELFREQASSFNNTQGKEKEEREREREKRGGQM